jgi:hypothetical protein
LAALLAASARSRAASMISSACLRAASDRLGRLAGRLGAGLDLVAHLLGGRFDFFAGGLSDLLAHAEHLVRELALTLEHLFGEIEDLIDHLIGLRGLGRRIADLAECFLGDLGPRLDCIGCLRLSRAHGCRELFLGGGHHVPSDRRRSSSTPWRGSNQS